MQATGVFRREKQEREREKESVNGMERCAVIETVTHVQNRLIYNRNILRILV